MCKKNRGHIEKISRKCRPKYEHSHPHISPKWGAIPQIKFVFSRSKGPQYAMVRWGIAPPKWVNPKIFKPHFLEKSLLNLKKKFCDRRGPQCLRFGNVKSRAPDPGHVTHEKPKKLRCRPGPQI